MYVCVHSRPLVGSRGSLTKFTAFKDWRREGDCVRVRRGGGKRLSLASVLIYGLIYRYEFVFARNGKRAILIWYD